MPLQSTETQVRLNSIVTCLTGVVKTLEILADSVRAPFLEPISNTSRSLLTVVQTVRKNKSDCTHLMEQTCKLLYAVVSLHLKSETGPELSPSQLNHLGKFTETLHKIHTFVEAQQDKSRLRRFFHQAEMNTVLKDCNVGLQQALDAFKIQDTNLLKDVADMQKYAQERHQEVLQLIEDLSDGTTSDKASSINHVFCGTHNSSNSISMLPSEPKIFHGRGSEISRIIKLFRQETPRIAILGAGGMGKTSLARAVLHHPEIITKYEQHRFFVACDPAGSRVELAALIGAHLGLKPGRDLTKPVVHYFAKSSASLLILDNLETPWEPTNTRRDTEEFLSLLTDVPHLALIITMRGVERPAKVRWTRPFLLPLQPLTQDAARQTFIEITDDSHDIANIDKILLLTGNMPLAVDLIAHLVDSEGFSYVLSRWDEEKTSLISVGFDRRSNLNLSISLSLTSPRITSLHHAEALLSLLTMLPDGLSTVELLLSEVPIDDILECKAALLRTSLVYSNDGGRLKTLVPIREYMQRFHPPDTSLVQPLLNYFQELLNLFHRYFGTLSTSGIVSRITSNFSNIQNILLNGIQNSTPDTIYSIIHLNTFSILSGRSCIPLLDEIPNVLPRLNDHCLEVYYVTEILGTWTEQPNANIKALVDQALKNLPDLNDSDLACRFYNHLGRYHLEHSNDLSAAISCSQISLSLAIAAGNSKRQPQALSSLALMKWRLGDYTGGQLDAYEVQRLVNISGDLWEEAHAAGIEADCWLSLGNYKQALMLCNRAKSIISEIHRLKSEYVAARNIQIQILNTVHVEQNRCRYAYILLNIADIGVSAGAPKDDIQSNVNRAKSIFNTLNYSLGKTGCEVCLADLALREGDLLAAQTSFQKFLTLPPGGHAEIHTYSLERLGDRSRWSGANWTPSWTTLKQNREIHQSLKFLGDVFRAEGDQDTAVTLFTVALEGFTQMDVHQGRADCMLRLGDISKDKEDLLNAVDLWKTARPLFERSSQGKQVALIDEKIGKISQDLLEDQ
ncbi:hypothetical protein B0H13DRAFT_1886794 [Mycena leptocephala]|nr:hypothetical protein B0H13DRAFT_1886794 [Mycena leptocephala]